jgi:hypothetical protein
MATKTLAKATAAFLLSEGEGSISRETVTLITGQNLAAGTVLGKITKGAAVFAHVAGGTGNATCSAITVGAEAGAGAYTLLFTAATKATIEDPAGVKLGVVTLGTAFSSGGIGFTLTAGATPHVANDQATITVAAGSGSYTAFNQDGTNGSEDAVAVLVAAVDATSEDKPALVINKLAEVSNAALTWPADITAGEKTVAIANMASTYLIVR